MDSPQSNLLGEGAAQAFETQSQACGRMGSPFMEKLCALIAQNGFASGAVFDRINHWNGTIGNGGDAVPLRLAGAFHRLVLDGADAGLKSVYPPNNSSDAELLSAVNQAVIKHADFILEYLKSAPQTNEVGRSALLLPAFLSLNAQYGIPFSLFEIGSSAGLNQNLPHFHYDYGSWQWGDVASPVQLNCEWRGEQPPVTNGDLHFSKVQGCDLAPVPISTDKQRMKLASYVWPDQTERYERLSGALALASKFAPAVDACQAAEWLGEKLSTAPEYGVHSIVMHTVMWQYLSKDDQALCEAHINAFGARAHARAPVSWLRFEADDNSPSGALTLTHFDGESKTPRTSILARADFHGRWIEWSPNLGKA
ncbi:DUF2332 family protein [Ahrensia kielensis]|uniref:DUF2332 family protein n=1 Tax=Ahrensia kielensis TaxID=76980 RepID=A0ABU9T4M7_9HYPH